MPLSLGPLSVACGWFLSAVQIWAEGETKTANGSISRDPLPATHPPLQSLLLGFLSGIPGDLPHPRRVRASQVEPGLKSGMNCISCLESRARCSERA